MQEHWNRFGPPTYVSVAGALGYKPDKKSKRQAGATPSRPSVTKVRAVDDLQSFIADFTSFGGVLQ